MTKSDLSIATVSEMTGVAKEVLRKWETRYGFPIPERNGTGHRRFTIEQVTRLRLIKSLLGRGMQARHIVALGLDDLTRLTATAPHAAPHDCNDRESRALFDVLTGDDPHAVRVFLNRHLEDLGLRQFVMRLLPSFGKAVGDGWAQGHLPIRSEHLYTEVVRSLLTEQLALLVPSRDGPRMLLATASGEVHTIGLLLVQTSLALEGAQCFSLGSSLPPQEIALAAAHYDARIVGLSFSNAFPLKKATAFLQELRSQLPVSTVLWAGGAGVTNLRRKIPGVDRIPTLELAVDAWKAMTAPMETGPPA